MDTSHWTEKRQKFWDELDIYDDKYVPVSKEIYVTYTVTVPMELVNTMPGTAYIPYRIYVDVDNYDCISLRENSYWFGVYVRDMDHIAKNEIYEFLSEWELIERHQIGPDDWEYFATTKLTGELVT